MSHLDEAVAAADKCLFYLLTAANWAKKANQEWKQAEPNAGDLVSDYQIERFAQDRQDQTVERLLLAIVRRRFPGLPFRAEEWRKRAREEKVVLTELADWFDRLVRPTYREVAWAHMLRLARSATYVRRSYVDEVLTITREAKLTKSRLTLNLYVWLDRWGEWRNRAWEMAGYLDGLEAVIEHAQDAELFRPLAWRALGTTLGEQEKPGLSCTGWVLCPRVRTFKNGRLDLYLRDEELAERVKEILESEEEE